MKLKILVLIMALSWNMRAQTPIPDRSVISSAFSSSTLGEWLLGETIIGDFIVADNIVNNGFLQGIFIHSTTSDLDEEFDRFLIYPNPANSWIKLRHNSIKPIDLQIYDLSGRLQFNLKNYWSDKKLDISFLPTGSYLLRYNSNHEWGRQLIIKL